MLCANIDRDITLGGRMTEGRGLPFYRQTFASHDSFVSFATSNKIGLGCAGDAFLLMHGDAVGVVSNEESLAVKKFTRQQTGNWIARPCRLLLHHEHPSSVRTQQNSHGGGGELG
jgi:hypothetical protein